MTTKKGNGSPDWTAFQGYTSPNYTQVPDQLFDEHLAFLSGAELKVLLYIIRRTFGFKKDTDDISLAQMLNGITTREGHRLDYGVGLTKKTLLQALRDLQEKHVIIAEQRQSEERGNEPTRYSLNLNGTTLGVKTTPPLAEKLHQGGGGEIPPSPRGKNYTTQETVLQETVLQETDLSNIRKGKPSEKKQEGRGRREQATQAGSSGTPGSFPEGIDHHLANHQPPRRRGTPSDAPGSSPAGFSSLADVIAAKRPKGASAGRTAAQKTHSDERQRILSDIERFARELGDEAPLPSSVSRAYNLWERSGIPIEAFTSLMYEAKSLTWEYSHKITKTKQGKGSVWGPEKNRMAYYFSILEKLVTRSTSSGEESGGEPDGTVPESREEVRQNTLPDAPESPVRPVSRPRRPLAPSSALPTYIADVAEEFGERVNAPAYLGEALDLYRQSELPEDAFLQVLSIARTMTQGKVNGEGNAMLHFFEVVSKQLGIDTPGG